MAQSHLALEFDLSCLQTRYADHPLAKPPDPSEVDSRILKFSFFEREMSLSSTAQGRNSGSGKDAENDDIDFLRTKPDLFQCAVQFPAQDESEDFTGGVAIPAAPGVFTFSASSCR
jgi:hypothetical protein